jgi:hypothetical protein
MLLHYGVMVIYYGDMVLRCGTMVSRCLVLHCGVMVLHCDAMVLHYGVMVLYYGAMMLRCLVLHCGAMVLHYGAMVLNCGAMVLHCGAMVSRCLVLNCGALVLHCGARYSGNFSTNNLNCYLHLNMFQAIHFKCRTVTSTHYRKVSATYLSCSTYVPASGHKMRFAACIICSHILNELVGFILVPANHLPLAEYTNFGLNHPAQNKPPFTRPLCNSRLLPVTQYCTPDYSVLAPGVRIKSSVQT